MSQIPNDLAETFELLKKDILWLHVQWKVYRQLFAVSEADIQLLNDAAPLAFGVYQEVLFSSVLLSLTRLTDPETTGKKENLTLERLVSLIDSSTYQALADKARQYLDQACKLCKPFREWRNRRYAHRDWLTAKEVHPDPLPGISRQRIEDTLAIIRNLMDEVSNHFGGSEGNYDQVLFIGGGDWIIQRLKESRAYRQHQFAGRVNPLEDGIA